MTGEAIVELSEEVAAAKAAGRGIVALESTIITHGLPWPQNLEVAEAVEATVRQRGAVPATIAVIAGRVHAGLSHDEIVALAQADDCLKLSRADLAYAVAKQRNGSTTVAATMIVARLAGISVFATGGIGGVHKGASESFDISADLEELARTEVTVVAAGAKAILDLPKTLEYLETKGVPVVGWGTDEFPAFWSRASGLPVPLRLDTADEFADFVAARRRLGTTGGIFVANPIPPEFEISREAIEAVIAEAVADAQAAGIKGKQVTPYLLSRMFDLTEGRSLVANRALILNNAALAADLAKAIAARG
ncbi:MAG: pseudouridine-5'-phosphate glycosidase [Ancalomicrobiaceae bacterium]|nr:pseudouridine-5'-phosphate glycosidase [Ancalomicrobiaceae bacterium]